jgi:hypothetical protein
MVQLELFVIYFVKQYIYFKTDMTYMFQITI